MSPYFVHNKNSQAFERAALDKHLLLSRGRWVFRYRIDCQENTFNRDGDRVGWRKTCLDPTEYVMNNMFCAEVIWSGLPSQTDSKQFKCFA